MAQHLTSPVKWYEIILRMLENGVTIFVEVGPKKILTGLLNKIIPSGSEAKVYNVEDMKSLSRFLEDL
jgi:[acyl-carrier-protein] S-malonyltransferase